MAYSLAVFCSKTDELKNMYIRVGTVHTMSVELLAQINDNATSLASLLSKKKQL